MSNVKDIVLMLLDLLRVGQAEDRFVKVYNVLRRAVIPVLFQTRLNVVRISNLHQRNVQRFRPSGSRHGLETFG